MADKLGAGDVFPAMTLSLVGGDNMALPDALDGRFSVLLFYRGHW